MLSDLSVPHCNIHTTPISSDNNVGNNNDLINSETTLLDVDAATPSPLPPVWLRVPLILLSSSFFHQQKFLHKQLPFSFLMPFVLKKCHQHHWLHFQQQLYRHCHQQHHHRAMCVAVSFYADRSLGRTRGGEPKKKRETVTKTEWMSERKERKKAV